MNRNGFCFREHVIFQLQSLFESYGYIQYKMNKFEEYDLYAKNKDFLLSDSVITFTDFGGKLMALKPDVTLSIVKNSRDDLKSQQKLFYNENVYRVDRGGYGFKEMTQVGLECIGYTDDFSILEVLMLAASSLKTISCECILDVSHLGILKDLLCTVGIPSSGQDAAFRYVAEKNIHELDTCCRSFGVSEEQINWLNRLIQCNGSPYTVLPVIRELLQDTADVGKVDRLIRIFAALQGSGMEDMFRFDFSAVDDIRYYNGIVFKGFVHGVPTSVLSGGQYDNLMRKMHRKSDAVGFAVYIDRLEQLEPKERKYDVDIVLLYEDSSLAAAVQYAEQLRRQGNSVMMQRYIPETVQYRQLQRVCGSEVEILEDNA